MLNVAVGDLLSGQVSLNLRNTTDTTAGFQYSVYSVGKGGSVSLAVDCASFVYPVNEIDIFNDYSLGSTGEFLDRYFANAGNINVGGSDGIQFWIDQQAVFPTLLASREIPTHALDLALSTSTTLLLKSPELEAQANFVELRDKGPSALLPKTKCDGPR